MDLQDLAGRSFGPRPFHIGGLAVSDFVDVTGDDSERWLQVAPPGFVSAALFAVAPDLLGLLTDRSVLHGEQTFRWTGSLAIGAEMAVTGTVTRVRERGGVSFVGFDIDVENREGQSVAGGSAMFLVSGESTATEMSERPEPSARDRGSPGESEVSMSRLDLVRYAAATRDFNPIHWDHGAAVDAGLPGVVVHGLAQASWALAAASRHRAGEVPLSSARIRFRSPLLPAAPVAVSEETEGSTVNVSVTDGETEYLSARIELAGG